VRSQQSSESSQHGGTPPGGIPGALTNQPPTNPSAPIITPKPPTGPAAPTAPGAAPGAAAGASTTTTTTAPSGPGSMRKDTVTNYELDRTIRHVQQGAGAIRRLSVAVVVNDKEVSEGGKTSARALTPAEVEQIRNLAREAVGFSQERGDSLNVVNTAFAQEDKEPPAPQVPYWRDPQNIDLAKTLGQYLLLAGLALFAWLAVVRPLMRKHLAPPPPPAPIAAPPAPAPVEAPTQAPAPEESLQDRELNRQKAIMDYAHQTADRDPKLVAALIQHWMNTP
jgi:flagellar M-ring protein FliF